MSKSKWLMVIVMVAIVIIGFIAKNSSTRSGVGSFTFVDNYDSSTWDLETTDRGLPFKFLFANAVKSPFSLSLNLGTRPTKGAHALWIYAEQADNHGQISIEYKGKTIGIVNNQLAEKSSAPIAKLSYVGDINITEDDVILKITGTNNKLDQHYAELGLLILAPKGMTEENLLSTLSAKGGAYSADFGLLLILLVASYAMLATLTKESNISQEYIRINDVLAVSIFATILSFMFITRSGESSPILSGQSTAQRSGVERFIDTGIKNAATKINQLQNSILPNRQQADDVPARLQISAGSIETNIYRSDKASGFESIAAKIFGGKMMQIQIMSASKFNTLSFWILFSVLVVAVLDRFLRSRWTVAVALGLISGLSILVSIRLSQGWDEFFINLRHAYMLLQHGVYSINANTMVEATVDFVPLLVTAFLGWVGLDLVDGFIVISLLGNIIVVVFSYLIVQKMTQDRTWSLLAALLLGLYPNVVWVGATGFTAVLFSGLILAASYFSLFTNRRMLGLCLLSLLTLVRTEGILFASILMAYIYVVRPLPEIFRAGKKWKPEIKRALVDGSIVAAPFILSLIVRKFVFGHAIPNPITFKNTNLDSSYFASGLNQLAQMISNHDLHLLSVLTILLLLANAIAWKNNNKLLEWRIGVGKLLALNIVMLIFVFPYYVGGGDWFPGYWNRYGLPFNLILFLTFMTLLYGAAIYGLKGWVRSIGLIFIFLAIIVGYQRSAHFRQDNYIYNTFDSLNNPYGRWQRVDTLSTLGQFLNNYLPKDAVVSSPEEATIMYFSERDMLGLLGVSNPDMSAMPLQPLGQGDILHRRRGYASVYKMRPDVIALYEPVVIGNFADNTSLKEKLHNTLQNEMFNSSMVNISYYRVGSYRALEKMGYRHVTISFTDRTFSVFVGKRVYDEFLKNIQLAGFTHFGTDSVSYSVDISNRYVPAVKELMNDL